MRAPLFLLILTGLLCLTMTTPVSAEADATFNKANADYAAGHFPDAIVGYESLVKNRQWNPVLFYDLGERLFSHRRFRTRDSELRAGSRPRSRPARGAGQSAIGTGPGARDRARPGLDGNASRFSDAGPVCLARSGGVLGCGCDSRGLYFAQRRAVVWIFALVLLGAISAGAAVVVYQLETGSAGAILRS